LAIGQSIQERKKIILGKPGFYKGGKMINKLFLILIAVFTVLLTDSNRSKGGSWK
jgi:hypothetical protein